MNLKSRAPAERATARLTFRSYGSEEEVLYESAFYKHFVPQGRGNRSAVARRWVSYL
jgi:hypothetical protein